MPLIKWSARIFNLIYRFGNNQPWGMGGGIKRAADDDYFDNYKRSNFDRGNFDSEDNR